MSSVKVLELFPARVSYLVEVLQQIHDPALNLIPRQTSGSRVASYARERENSSDFRLEDGSLSDERSLANNGSSCGGAQRSYSCCSEHGAAMGEYAEAQGYFEPGTRSRSLIRNEKKNSEWTTGRIALMLSRSSVAVHFLPYFSTFVFEPIMCCGALLSFDS